MQIQKTPNSSNPNAVNSSQDKENANDEQAGINFAQLIKNVSTPENNEEQDFIQQDNTDQLVSLGDSEKLTKQQLVKKVTNIDEFLAEHSTAETEAEASTSIEKVNINTDSNTLMSKSIPDLDKVTLNLNGVLKGYFQTQGQKVDF